MIAVYAGSFSPPTKGHLDIIRRASGMFDGVIVAVLSQQEKQYRFSPEQRVRMLERVTRDFPNVRVICDAGLLVDVVRKCGADVILRGLRGASDLPFEMQLAEANRRIGGVETLFMNSLPEFSMISSTIVRDCAAHGAPIESMVPEEISGEIYTAYGVSPDAERKGQ